MKPLLIGELNPYGGDPYYALVPYPDGCAGHRLCVKILDMGRKEYLETFDRINLCTGKWSIKDAKAAARRLGWRGEEDISDRKVILLGSKVCSAFDVTFSPFTIRRNKLVLPHPSGRCRLWDEYEDSFKLARKLMEKFLR